MGRSPTRFGEALGELRALFDEVAEVDWHNPQWGALALALATSETLNRRVWTPQDAADSFVLALQANSAPAADTFMTTEIGPSPSSLDMRIALAAHRARAVVRTFQEHDRTAPDQPLIKALHLDGGWLRPWPLHVHPVGVAFTHRGRAWWTEVHDAEDATLEGALRDVVNGQSAPRMRAIDSRASTPTPAAAAIAIDPVSLRWARSFHRIAWTRAGGPWLGVADHPPHLVVSTCHAAVDGYVHARVASAIAQSDQRFDAPNREVRLEIVDPENPQTVAPPQVGFAMRRLVGPPPRFARAVHAFASVLDRRLGAPESGRSVPFHIPIAPGRQTDQARWRRRPLYGLLSLRKHDGVLEDLEALERRLPRFLQREADGRGILTRVLRSVLELPLPVAVRRRVIMRQPWADRFFSPAQVLTGGGYISWMRFAASELPALPMFPSAVPSFSADRGGAGLSVAPYAQGLAVGLTTSGRLGRDVFAEAFLEEWVQALERAHRGGQRQLSDA